MGIKFAPIRPYKFTTRGDRIGWVKGEEGNWHLTLFIENGRITDQPGGKQLKTGLRKIAEIHKGDFRLTANQNLIVAGVPPRDKKRIDDPRQRIGNITIAAAQHRVANLARKIKAAFAQPAVGKRHRLLRQAQANRRIIRRERIQHPATTTAGIDQPQSAHLRLRVPILAAAIAARARPAS